MARTAQSSKITPSGLTTIYTFCLQGNFPDCPDGVIPEGALIQATNGVLDGTTQYGGANGAGTVFAITPSDALTTIYRFCPC